MDRALLAAALRVLICSYDGRRAAVEDVNLLRAYAAHAERDFDLEELARSIAQRFIKPGRSRGIDGLNVDRNAIA